MYLSCIFSEKISWLPKLPRAPKYRSKVPILGNIDIYLGSPDIYQGSINKYLETLDSFLGYLGYLDDCIYEYPKHIYVYLDNFNAYLGYLWNLDIYLGDPFSR